MPKVTGNMLKDFSTHLAVKNPQGATRKDINKHVQHHSPGQPDADPVKLASAKYVRQHFGGIDSNHDHKVTSQEVLARSKKLDAKA